MMGKINMVIVPSWLNLIMKELGIGVDDLADYGKLSGILSPRDLLNYKMINFRAAEVMGKWVGCESEGSKAIAQFTSSLPTPTLEERAFCANVSIDTLIYGTTHTPAGQKLVVEVEMTQYDVLAIRLTAYKYLAEEQQHCDPLLKQIVKVLHGRICLKELAEIGAFSQYIDSVPVDPVFY